MVVALGNRQVGQQSRIIEGGGHLADPAAVAIPHLTLAVNMGNGIALFRCSWSHYLVEGELLPGKENSAIYGCGSKPYIDAPVSVVGGVGGEAGACRGQNIPKQQGFQIPCFYLRLGYLYGKGYFFIDF